jgi:hypothetical protein
MEGGIYYMLNKLLKVSKLVLALTLVISTLSLASVNGQDTGSDDTQVSPTFIWVVGTR